jgi:hypothetical protein
MTGGAHNTLKQQEREARREEQQVTAVQGNCRTAYRGDIILPTAA